MGTALDSIETSGQADMGTGVEREEMFQRVLDELGPSLVRLTLGYEFDPEQRRDLLQEIHLAVWRSLDVFDGRCSLRTWVYRVAHNTAATHVLKAKRRSLVDLQSLDQFDEPQDPRSLEPEIQRALALQQLSMLILRLKPLDRQVILLYLEDLSADDIAETTGLAHGTVRVRIHRIKQLLQKMFNSGDRHDQR
jgi:RNA polymerase sigma-70 factor (ECF subfamily)